MGSPIPDRWNAANVRAALNHPRLVEREIRIWLSRLTYPVQNRRRKREYGGGVDVVARDWDNLLILDACRVDGARERNTIQGDLDSVVSRGSTSSEFIQRNFVGRELHDTVYVTANPYVEMIDDGTFYAVESLLVDGWDPDLGTVPPQAVVDAATEAHERYPDKRLIVHFMQPHQPFIGPTARALRDELGLDGGYDRYHCVDGKEVSPFGVTLFGAAMQGDVTLAELRDVYLENVDLAIEHAHRLVAELDGKSVVTADHGELLGERLAPLAERSFGHFPDCYAPELREVPWLEVPCEQRRDVTADEPLGFERLDQQRVDSRLQALGYVPE